MSSNPNFFAQIGTLARVFLGVLGAAMAAVLTLIADWARGLLGRPTPIRIVRDPGESATWRKSQGSAGSAATASK